MSVCNTQIRVSVAWAGRPRTGGTRHPARLLRSRASRVPPQREVGRRSVDGFYSCVEEVTESALGADQVRPAGLDFELAAQAQNLYIHAAIEDVIVIATADLDQL